MTQDQVKSELQELRKLGSCCRDILLNNRWCELRNKYDIAINQLDTFDQLIFRERIILGRTFIKAGMVLHYSEDHLRKRFKKITKQLAEILTKSRTNFDRITENEETLADYISMVSFCPFGYTDNVPCHKDGCKECIKEWLQKEVK